MTGSRIVPAAFVHAPLVITFDPSRFEVTYDFRGDDGDDPRFNTSLPMGLRAPRPAPFREPSAPRGPRVVDIAALVHRDEPGRLAGAIR